MECLYTSLDTDQIKLAGLPNIVEMVAVFADQVLGLPEDVQLYGDALPARLSPRVGVATVLAVWLIISVQGCGRNMSLFSVMKKYDLSLADYLEKNRDLITPRTCLILLTQLLEGTQCVLNTCCPVPSTAQVSPPAEWLTEISSVTTSSSSSQGGHSSLNWSSLTLGAAQLTRSTD